jgi:hypothetical protein
MCAIFKMLESNANEVEGLQIFSLRAQLPTGRSLFRFNLFTQNLGRIKFKMIEEFMKLSVSSGRKTGNIVLYFLAYETFTLTQNWDHVTLQNVIKQIENFNIFLQ